MAATNATETLPQSDELTPAARVEITTSAVRTPVEDITKVEVIERWEMSMDKTLVGLTGEYYVLAQLTQRELVATLTLSNTKGVDILVANPDLDQLYKVEVKTTDQRPNASVYSGKNSSTDGQ